jgi:hypothetical protein
MLASQHQGQHNTQQYAEELENQSCEPGNSGGSDQ